MKEGGRCVELRASELAMILDGIDMTKLKRVPRYERVTAARERTEDLERTSGGNREKVAI